MRHEISPETLACGSLQLLKTQMKKIKKNEYFPSAQNPTFSKCFNTNRVSEKIVGFSTKQV
jgi:hypothetical protein